MSEIKQDKPRSLWSTALKAVKGDNTAQLIEQFTSEMTLVAEGLADDQSRLDRQLDGLSRQNEKTEQRLQSETEALWESIRQSSADTDRKLEALGRSVNELGMRMDELQKQLRLLQQKTEKPSRQSMLRQITVLACILCGTILIVSVLKLFA